ncbi:MULTISPECIES: hypothetical protein [Chryseobacterium]|uniref:TraB/GumN family protein n=1 Tax=Chryseobacterium balustinum TaxID=246 RepID=A0AAX2ILC3_9FLAO|nr:MULTISPECIES: hypothetical protein [Chryseobacterium]AZB29724.1 hypothetical protein EB354_10920 [Chryseobacterium balustinum]MDY0931110.1 hypothetical protein [Chryseobacterium sp. CFBP8996]SKB91557.1 hypothetical protein SAMN05421800_11422 [Chryseobacterium balustinum]SQA90084.1 Uncharacterised protein [Chryseobacterium balustinum]
MKKITFLLLTLFITNYNYAQNTVLDSLVQKNGFPFQTDKNISFQGKGWDVLLNEIKQSNSVLLGETHFTNEIPYFTNAIINEVKFDNYFLEVDPYSVDIIETKVKSLSPEQLKSFVKKYSTNFSFLEYEPEFDLFKNLVKGKTKIYGVEQISVFADQMIISGLKETSKNKKAIEVYEQMLHNSKLAASKDGMEKYYLLSEDCLQKIDSLLKLKLSDKERKQIEDLKLSREIYVKRSHPLRIQLLKNILLTQLPDWKNKKNLFKFGAVHLPKGETILTKTDIYDIGNLISNIEEANHRKSLHIMLIGKGEDENDDTSFKSFQNVMKEEQWYCFDLRPLKKSILQNKLKIDDVYLSRVIKGYDYLIYIPKVTKSKEISIE